MKFSTSKFNQKLAIAALVASAFGVSAIAQNATPGTPPEGRGGMQHQMGKMGAGEQGKGQGAGQEQGPGFMKERMQAHRQARAEKRLADLKGKLKITAAQEAAWTTFAAAMKPPADGAKGAMGMRHDPAQHAEMQKLTTPERIEKMRAMRQSRQAQMNTEMDKRADATKSFYATLSSEQKAVFDAVGMQGGPGGHFGRGEHSGMMGGHHGGMGGDHRGHGRMGPAN